LVPIYQPTLQSHIGRESESVVPKVSLGSAQVVFCFAIDSQWAKKVVM